MTTRPTKTTTSLETYRTRGALVGGERLTRDALIKMLRTHGKKTQRAIEDFKTPEQELVVYRVLEGEDVLAIMPTGSGKSLTYQFPALIDPGSVSLVISPLKALMKQHAELPGAIRLDSDTDITTRPDIWRQLKDGERCILLVSPEMLARQHQRLAELPISRFVVDEVHCLSDWGHDFRPHYWWICHFLRQLEAERRGGHIPRLLLTATANDRVIHDIEQHFPEIHDANIVRAPLGREEILLAAQEVTTPATRLRAMLRFLERQKSRPLPRGTRRRGIVFNLEAVGGEEARDLASVDHWKADEIVQLLRRNGFPKTYAYASRGLSSVERQAAVEAFESASPRAGQATVIVATNAFGMGMDFDGTPFVCHAYPRPNLSEYWQQVGRAGRGLAGTGGWAETLALYSEDDGGYAQRFAKAPALDGLLNAFTIPLHGWMYVWKRGGAEMCLEGEGGGTTYFSRLLDELLELGVLVGEGQPVRVPRGTIRYRVDLDLLRRVSTRHALASLRDVRFKRSKRLRKVFRYLAIAARSKPKEFILLDQTEHSEDRYGTVLQRLNRWVDLGLLERCPKHKRTGEVRLLRVGRNLMDSYVTAIANAADTWARHKQKGVEELMGVLRAASPAERRRLVLRHFGEREVTPPVAFDVPAWLHQ